MNLLFISDSRHSLLWKTSEKRQFLSACFIQPDSSHLVAIDGNNVLHVFSVHTKEEAWRHEFLMKCKMIMCHPKLPIVHVFTEDGRVIVVAILIRVRILSKSC